MAKNKDNIESIRHSLAHLMAIAVLDMFPKAKLGIGPTIENGFYYDFDLSAEALSEGGLTLDHLPKLEKKIKEIIKQDIKFEREEISAEKAKDIFASQPFKLELIEELEKSGEQISIYKSGDFTDLCAGPHIESSKEINPDAFKLTKVAGAYWRGNEKNKMLTRIYGLAFLSKQELDDYLKMLEEAEKRDHRKLGKELGLFTFSDLVGAGLPLFTPKGAMIRNLIAGKIQKIQNKFGYENVWIPHIAKKDLYEKSGHWDKFKEDLFHVKGKSETEFVMKPMNCPHHTQIYASAMRSYRDLPIRFAEVTTNYRDEKPGELLGLSRVRSLTQDDGHVFCAIDQVEEEIKNIISVIREFYSSLDMFKENDYWVSLSVRNPQTPEKYLGNNNHWKKAEDTLEKIAESEKLNYKKVEGEAAFYGPKLDFMFKDSIGREWQLATVQLDFSMPERFGLKYIDNNGHTETPIMIHRAIAGSLERFMSVIIEHYAGAFPFWLSPIQAVIIPVGEKFNDYGEKVLAELKNSGIRAEMDKNNETLGKKIRANKTKKIPYLLVVGEKEKEAGTVAVNFRDKEKQETLPTEEFVKLVQKEIEEKK